MSYAVMFADCEVKYLQDEERRFRKAVATIEIWIAGRGNSANVA